MSDWIESSTEDSVCAADHDGPVHVLGASEYARMDEAGEGLGMGASEYD